MLSVSKLIFQQVSFTFIREKTTMFKLQMNLSKFLYKIAYLKKQTGLHLQILKYVIEFILSFISYFRDFKIEKEFPVLYYKYFVMK